MPAHLLRTLPRRRRRRLAVALLAQVVLAGAPPAAALSRAMWAEFNTIYLINLKPAAECRAYRTRSIELLKDASLSPAALDERMHALWNEAKANCLAKPEPEQPSARQQLAPAAAAARPPDAAPATPVAVKPPVATASTARSPAAPPPAPAAAAPAPTPALAALPPPPPTPVAAAGSAPHVPVAPTSSGPAAAGPLTTVAVENAAAAEHASATGGRGNTTPGIPMQSVPGTKAAGDGRPQVALPQLKPAIERPLVADLRLEAACAKRNPYAYQVAGDDPCARLASAKVAKADPVATKEANPESRIPAWVWAVSGGVLAALGGAGGWWLWWRRRSRTVAASADVGHDGAGDAPAGQPPQPADDGSPSDSHQDESLAPALS